MPIVIEYLPSGEIIGGFFYSYIPDGAVESGEWLAIIPGAVYGRMAHTVGTPVLPPGSLGTFGNGHRAGMAGWHQFQAAVGEAGVMLPGWAGGQQVVSTEPQPFPQAPLVNRERARSPSPPPARSSKRRRTGAGPSLEVKLPIAVHVDETGGAVSIANTTNKGATQRAADIPHIGPSFRNRRGLLLRADSPYICQLCGEAFLHPADVKAHFNGHRDNPGHGCWEEHGSRPGVAWNDHRSCKISEDELRSVRCKEGWVIVDQESWDRINAAADAGRVFKAEKKAAKAAQETVEGAEEVEGTDSKPAEEPVSMVQKEPAGRKKAAGKKELPERKERPKRKVSLGTKVASEGKEAEGSKELPEPKDAPKRKVVRAGDETETDVGARKR